MTVRQIIQEIEALSPHERKEVSTYLQEKEAPSSHVDAVRYLDRQAAQPLIQEILQTHSELFQKLAK